MCGVNIPHYVMVFMTIKLSSIYWLNGVICEIQKSFFPNDMYHLFLQYTSLVWPYRLKVTRLVSGFECPKYGGNDTDKKYFSYFLFTIHTILV